MRKVLNFSMYLLICTIVTFLIVASWMVTVMYSPWISIPSIVITIFGWREIAKATNEYIYKKGNPYYVS